MWWWVVSSNYQNKSELFTLAVKIKKARHCQLNPIPRWTFKLYDKDGSGEIDPDEMEDIFRKLCKIAAGIESDQSKILAKVSPSTKMTPS